MIVVSGFGFVFSAAGFIFLVRGSILIKIGFVLTSFMECAVVIWVMAGIVMRSLGSICFINSVRCRSVVQEEIAIVFAVPICLAKVDSKAGVIVLWTSILLFRILRIVLNVFVSNWGFLKGMDVWDMPYILRGGLVNIVFVLSNFCVIWLLCF